MHWIPLSAASKLGVARGKDTLDLLTKLIDDHYEQVRDLAFDSVGEQGERALPMTRALIAAMTGPKGANVDIEDIPGAILSGRNHLRGAARALFDVGPKTVSVLLAQHAKGSVRLQFRVLNVLGGMGEQSVQFLGGLPNIEMLNRIGSIGPHTVVQILVLNSRLDGISQCVGVTVWHQQSVVSVMNNFGDSRHRRCDYRQTTSQRFHD